MKSIRYRTPFAYSSFPHVLLFADMDEPKRKEVDGDEFQAMYWTGNGRPAGPARSFIH